MLPPELAPIRVGLEVISLVMGIVNMGKSVPEADGQVAGVHAVLGIVFLDLVEVLSCCLVYFIV